VKFLPVFLHGVKAICQRFCIAFEIYREGGGVRLTKLPTIGIIAALVIA
jgi:hypothetical protein